MNLFLPGLRELARIYDRQVNRASLWLARRNLAKAETDLGLLGWQQADFVGDAQLHVEKLTHVEREQARRTNESAELGQVIRQTQEKRAAERQQYEETRVVLETAWVKAKEPVVTAEGQLSARRKTDVDFARFIADLDRELEEVEATRAELLTAETATPKMRSELSRLQARAAVIPSARADLQHRQAQSVKDIRALQEALAVARPALAVATEKLNALDTRFARSDGTLERTIAGQVTKKEALEKQVESLEKAKNNPYRQIGQILADNGIAPMNQPEALQAVLHLRAVVAGLVRRIFESHEVSNREDSLVLRKSWALWAVIVGLLSLVLLFFAN